MDWLAGSTEFLLSSYHLTLHDAVYQFPLVVAIILQRAASERSGNSSAISYADDAALNARRKVRRYYEENYTITP